MIPLSDGIRARRFPVINSSASRIWVWLPVSPSAGQRTHADRMQRQRLHPFTGGYRSSNIG